MNNHLSMKLNIDVVTLKQALNHATLDYTPLKPV